MFDAAKFPNHQVRGDKFNFNGDKVTEVTGTLTLLGKTQPVTLKATNFNCYDSPMLKREVCGGDFEATHRPHPVRHELRHRLGLPEERAPGDPGRSGQAVSAQNSRPKASTCAQSVNSTTAVGSVGPLVISMMKRIIWRSKNPYFG